MMQQETSGQIGRKKKSPEELAAEARGEGGGEGGSGKSPQCFIHEILCLGSISRVEKKFMLRSATL